MAMPAQPTEWTAEMVRALPDDGNRYEVIDGELFVTPAPSWTHQTAVLELAVLLRPYLQQHRIGHVIVSPADVLFGPRNIVEPDVFVVPLVGGAAPQAWEEVGRLLLTAEVISPSTVRTDREDKRKLYQRKAVPEYWIVDVDAQVFERWRPGSAEPDILTETVTWQPDRLVPPLVIDLADYFNTRKTSTSR
jgi:Uma2 family endonuclease